MKKLLSITSILCFIWHVSFAETPAPIVAEDADNYQAVAITSELKAIPKNLHEDDATLRYTIDADYPEITGENFSSNAEQFNKLVAATVQQEVDQFKKYVKVDAIHMKTLPESAQHNSFKMDYDIDVIKPEEKHPLVVVRFSIEGMQAGRAHPYHVHRVINFDLSKGKALDLQDLFKPHANYLTVLSQYANKKLYETLEDKFMIKDGTAPNPQNYKVWNLESDGILITFDEYQVAPYVAGPQEVLIPYDVLKKIMAPNAPIARA